MTINPPSLRFILSIVFLLAIGSSMATTYYVDALSGNDSNTGTSEMSDGRGAGPWQTILKVNSTTFSPGDRILFRRGNTWTGQALIPKNGGTAGGTITIQDEILSQPILFNLVDPNNNNCVYFGAYGTGNKPRIDCSGQEGLLLKHNYLIVEDLHLDNGGNGMLSFERLGGNYWTIVRNIDVTNCSGNAVRFDEGGSNCWLDGLYVRDYVHNGIYLNGSPANKLSKVLVENCHVENSIVLTREDAISCHREDNTHDIAGDIIIRNNTIVRSGEDGIDITSGTNILVEGNHISHSLSAGIFIGKPLRVHTVEVRGNFLTANSISKGNGGLTIKTNKVRAINNIITGTGHHSLHIGTASEVEIWNNVIAPENRTGNFIYLRDSLSQIDIRNNIFDFTYTDQDISGSRDSVTFDYNCYHLRTPDQDVFSDTSFVAIQNMDPAFEANGLFANPEFVDLEKSLPEHFQLDDSSPCINRGDNNVPVYKDYWGTIRPQGPSVDLGAYEAQSLDCAMIQGAVCDDGDDCTENDRYDSNCNCIGDLIDNDNNGICDINLPTRLNVYGNDGSDDVEERIYDGDISMKSSDLELTIDDTDGEQILGIRFNNISIPQGASIDQAFVQFTVDEITTGVIALQIEGEAADNARPFSRDDYDVSIRNRTSTSVSWSPDDWNTLGHAKQAQRTVDISDILQEIIDRPGWQSGNSVALIISGTGQRTAISYDASLASGPSLHIDFFLTNCSLTGACDDGDPCTMGDFYDEYCNCTGTIEDADNDGVCDAEDICPNGDDNQDADGDGFPDVCDICPNSTIHVDSDNDRVCDENDICPGFNDFQDADLDGVPDGCDVCQGFDDNVDADLDGVPDACDLCPGSDDLSDSDGDGTPDGCDMCPGFDDAVDTDGDMVADGCDTCNGFDDRLDMDGDGTPDACDVCPGFDDSIDTDGDGFVDGCDICPGFDDLVDSDGDGVPDGCDMCPGFDDTADEDGDGVPDDCDDPSCTTVTNYFPNEQLVHTGSSSSSIEMNFGGMHSEVLFSISGINQKIDGKKSRRYVEIVTVEYVDDQGVLQFYDSFSGANTSSVEIAISIEVLLVRVTLEDGYDGSTESQMSITLSPVSSCDPGYSCDDSDGDGVCDMVDTCPGFDDNLDADGDGTPDGCESEQCNEVETLFPESSLTHSGSGSNDLTLDFGAIHRDASFIISDLDRKINGKPENRFSEQVIVEFDDGSGSNILVGIYDASTGSSVPINIGGSVQAITLTLQDGFDGEAPVELSVDLSPVMSCEPAAALNADTFNDSVNDTSHEQDLMKDDDVHVYPNPTNNLLYIEFETPQESSVGMTITDIHGNILQERSMNLSSGLQNPSLDVSRLSAGIYFVHLGLSHQLVSKKFVVLR